MQEGVFHQMPVLVQVFIVGPLLDTIFLGRDHHLHAFLLGLLNNRIGVIGAIGQKELSIDPFYETVSLCAIRNCPLREQCSNGHAVGIHSQMHLGVEPPFVRFMAWFPPLAPAA